MKLFLQSLVQIPLLQKQTAWLDDTRSGPSRLGTSAKCSLSNAQDHQTPLASESSIYRGTLEPLLNDKTEAFISKVLKNWDSPGGAGIAVVRKDEEGKWLVETRGYGIANAEGDEVDKDTLFGIGSNSKLFNAISAGLLIHNTTLQSTRTFGVDLEGNPKPLDWMTPLKDVIPGFDLWDQRAAERVTILDALSHRTGVPSHDAATVVGFEVPDTIKKVKHLRPSRPFRDVWQYNNLMYEICSYLPTAILPSKIPYARYVKENIFEPLGLTSTTYSYEIAKRSGKLADGFARDKGVKDEVNGLDFTARAIPYWNQGSTEDGNGNAGDGGVISSAKDVATWLQTLLLLGKNPVTNERVIPSEVVEKVAKGVMVVKPKADWPEISPTVYGMGQERGSYRGHEWVEHLGDIPGMKSIIVRFPKENVGIAILTNDDERGFPVARTIQYYLADVAFGLKPVDWHQRFKDGQKKKEQEAEIAHLARSSRSTPKKKLMRSSRDIWDLEGIYNNPGYGSKYLCVIHPPPSPDVPPGAPGPCKDVRDNVRKILPGVQERAEKDDVPTLVAEWSNPFVGWIVFRNYAGDSSRVYNMSAATSYPTGDSSRPYWVAEDVDVVWRGATAEVVYTPTLDGGSRASGLGLNGIWGAKSPEDVPEVWFDKV